MRLRSDVKELGVVEVFQLALLITLSHAFPQRHQRRLRLCRHIKEVVLVVEATKAALEVVELVGARVEVAPKSVIPIEELLILISSWVP